MKKIIFFNFFIFLCLIPLVSFGDTTGGNGTGGTTGGNNGSTPVNYNITIKNPLANHIDNFQDLLDFIILKIINPIGAVLAVLMIMYAGFMYVTAQGDPTKIKAAHQALLYAAIGSAILLGANLIAKAIQETVTKLN